MAKTLVLCMITGFKDHETDVRTQQLWLVLGELIK